MVSGKIFYFILEPEKPKKRGLPAAYRNRTGLFESQAAKSIRIEAEIEKVKPIAPDGALAGATISAAPVKNTTLFSYNPADQVFTAFLWGSFRRAIDCTIWLLHFDLLAIQLWANNWQPKLRIVVVYYKPCLTKFFLHDSKCKNHNLVIQMLK